MIRVEISFLGPFFSLKMAKENFILGEKLENLCLSILFGMLKVLTPVRKPRLIQKMQRTFPKNDKLTYR